MSYLTETFDLKSGTSPVLNKPIVCDNHYNLIQFHPAYSYEDFVRGIVAEVTESGSVSYIVKNRIFADLATAAFRDKNNNYVLIIDEINRANLPSVLGELIYGLEYRNESFISLYEYNGSKELTIPDNLYIIGTMNTADRSVGHIDFAIRRRFAFVDVPASENVIEEVIDNTVVKEKAKNLFRTIASLFTSEYLSSDFSENDVMIGHSYFLAQNESELRIKLEYEIKPILREYLKDGILLSNASQNIEKLNA